MTHKKLNNLCLAYDDYLIDRPCWVAELSNGLTVYQDDGRPEVDPPSAWIRLRNYLKETGEYIKKMYLQFRSHIETPLPEGAEGYYFSHMLLTAAGAKRNATFFVIGYLRGESIYIQKWKVPELQFVDAELRNRHTTPPLCLITKDKK